MIQQIWVHFWDSFKNISNLEAYKQYFTQTVSDWAIHSGNSDPFWNAYYWSSGFVCCLMV